MPMDKMSLASALEGFGLSDYEARSYIALLRHGPLLASELAYKAGIPRTKAYSTIKNLVRKGLASISTGKPVRCYPVPPEDSLDKVVLQEEKHLRSMRKAVFKLRRFQEESKKPIEVEERKFLFLGANATSVKMSELLLSTKQSFHCAVDAWGYRLLEQASDTLTSLSDVDLRAIVDLKIESTGVEAALADNLEARVGKLELNGSFFIFDEDALLLVNGSSGFGIMVNSKEICTIMEKMVFERLWAKSVALKSISTLLSMPGGEDAFDLLNSDVINDIFFRAVCEGVDNEAALQAIGEKFVSSLEEQLHIDLFRTPFEAAMPVLNILLLQSLGEGARVRFDPVTRILTVESSGSGKGLPSSVWLFALSGLLARNAIPMVILQNICYGAENTHILQAKINIGHSED